MFRTGSPHLAASPGNRGGVSPEAVVVAAQAVQGGREVMEVERGPAARQRPGMPHGDRAQRPLAGGVGRERPARLHQ